MTTPPEPLVPLPDAGRRFTAHREVRLSDASLTGRLRLDAFACYLQDIGNDDARDAIGEDAAAWVVRKTTIDVFQWPRFQERVDLTTFCGGTGGRWAERRTSLRGEHGGHLEAAALWVHIDMASGRPSPLPATFMERFGDGWGTRKVSGRLSHGAPPAGGARRAWPFRTTDFDVMGHVNNAAYWCVVEDVLLDDPSSVALPARFELEYRVGVEPHHETDVVVDGSSLWLVGGTDLHASARVSPLR